MAWPIQSARNAPATPKHRGQDETGRIVRSGREHPRDDTVDEAEDDDSRIMPTIFFPFCDASMGPARSCTAPARRQIRPDNSFSSAAVRPASDD
jgi:hypothetical protein